MFYVTISVLNLQFTVAAEPILLLS